MEQLKKEEESDEEDDEEFNEECEECGAKMSTRKLTEEEYDEHPDRQDGYCSTHSCAWWCIKCRDFYQEDKEVQKELELVTEFKLKYCIDKKEED